MELGLAGAADAAVYETAVMRRALLLTQDLDFTDEALYPPLMGLVVVRLRRNVHGAAIIQRCLTVFEAHGETLAEIGNGVMIIESARVRIRRRP